MYLSIYLSTCLSVYFCIYLLGASLRHRLFCLREKGVMLCVWNIPTRVHVCPSMTRVFDYIDVYIYTICVWVLTRVIRHIYIHLVRMCMYIHIQHVRVYTRTYESTYICMCACMYVCMYVCMYTRTCACTYACVYACVYLYIRTYTFVWLLLHM